VGFCAILRDGASEVSVKVVDAVGGYFKSLKVESPSFSIHKAAGKYSKTVNFKIYSLAEFLHRYVKPVEMVVGVDMAQAGADKTYTAASTAASKVQKAKSDLHFLKFKAAVSSAYESLWDFVKGKGFELGSFLAKQTGIRFRLKGYSKPLRFYFAYTQGKLLCSVGYTNEKGAAQHGSTFSKPDSEAILKFLKEKVNVHIGG
jgi:hypothetical protein